MHVDCYKYNLEQIGASDGIRRIQGFDTKEMKKVHHLVSQS